MNRKIVSALTAVGVGTVIAVGGAVMPAQAATAATWDPYCQAHVYDGVPWDTYLSRTAQCRIQGGPARMTAQVYTYTGPIDGVMGSNSWKGLQAYLKAHYGYGGPVDGVPGTNTYKAMQTWGRAGGYTGLIDGVMGPNSWAGFNGAVRMAFFND